MKRAPALSVGPVLAAVAALTLGCSAATGTAAQHDGPVGAVPTGLEQFYGQNLSWAGCSAFAT
ncbi:MAG: Alpha/beta hydrolase, partial [Pseudonocardiales bacterium]|nr:Alpha/beta hydrolase [Pseudonocardiales bacterium]